MKDRSFAHTIGTYLFYFSCILWAFGFPTYAAEQLNGFRDLKFGMTQQEVKALKDCSTSHECLYELSDKARYIQLTYDKDMTTSGVNSPEPPRLAKITIDMGRYTDAWYQQLQIILGNSYRLTHDFTDETMNAFLEKKLDELNAGYEDGQIVLKVVRRQFGNMILKVVYQNATHAAEFTQQANTPPTSTP